jgi:hypothetical protein
MFCGEHPIGLAGELKGSSSTDFTRECVARGTRELHRLAVSVRARHASNRGVRNGWNECVVTHDWHAILCSFDEWRIEEASTFARNEEIFALCMRRAIGGVAVGTSICCRVKRQQNRSSKEN